MTPFLTVKLIYHKRAGRWAFSWTIENVTFVSAGFRYQARAISAVNDLCAQIGAVPDFVR